MPERDEPISRGAGSRPRSPDRPVPEGEIDWSLATFDGVRRAQEREFLLLSFREKLVRLEQMAEVAEWLRRGA